MKKLLVACCLLFTVASYAQEVGDVSPAGGRILRIFKQGDKGFVQGEVHGLVVKTLSRNNKTHYQNALLSARDGWRLPTSSELSLIFTFKAKTCPDCADGPHWTSDAIGDAARTIDFSTQQSNMTKKNQPFASIVGVKNF